MKMTKEEWEASIRKNNGLTMKQAILLVMEYEEEIEYFKRKYENTGAMFNRQNMKRKIDELESVISRLRCEECGDELGTDWEAGSVVLCGDCE